MAGAKDGAQPRVPTCLEELVEHGGVEGPRLGTELVLGLDIVLDSIELTSGGS